MNILPKALLMLFISSYLYCYSTNVHVVQNKRYHNRHKSFISVPSLLNHNKVVLAPKDILITTKKFYQEFKGGQELLKKSTAYIVFPKVNEGSLIVGAKYGFGALVQNNSIASYYKSFSTSIGIQVGFKNYSLLVVFLTKESLDRFTKREEWKISAESELSFTSWHKGLDINTLDLKKDTIVIPFNNTGIMAGVSLEGTVFQQLKLGR